MKPSKSIIFIPRCFQRRHPRPPRVSMSHVLTTTMVKTKLKPDHRQRIPKDMREVADAERCGRSRGAFCKRFVQSYLSAAVCLVTSGAAGASNAIKTHILSQVHHSNTTQYQGEPACGPCVAWCAIQADKLMREDCL